MSSTITPTPALVRNLTTLRRHQPEVARRLSMPVAEGHVLVSPLRLRQHRSAYPLKVSPGELESVADLVGDGSILVFGVGCGDLVDAALRAHPDAAVIAWDRDPFMLRLAMSLYDFSEAMSSGRLRWSVCEGLMDHVATPCDEVLLHPLLHQVYTHEHHMLALDSDAPTVLMCAGGLFVDDVADCFEQAGMGVFTWEISRMSAEGLEAVAERIAPEFVFAINYTVGLAEACAALGLPLLVWEIDPATDGLEPAACSTDHVHIHTYRSSNVERFQAAGFRNVSYTPLAANTVKRSPPETPVLDGPEVCFVGASMVDQAQHFRSIFFRHWVAHHGGHASAQRQGEQVLEAILAAQRARPRQHIVPELMLRHIPDFVAAAGGKMAHDPVALVSEMAAAERRLNVVARLGGEGIHVWGDPGWRVVESHGASYRGFAGHHVELTEIYRGGKIHVDINRLYQLDIVPMRVFDILACGGFLIAEYSPALAECFEIGKELETWDSIPELVEKVQYYRDHPEEAFLIAQRGLDAIRNRHSIAGRLFGMLRDLPRKTEISAVG